MDDFKHYARTQIGDPSLEIREITGFWKANKKVNLGTNKDGKDEPWLVAFVALSEDLDDGIPNSTGRIRYWRISREAFKKSWNENFDSLQKAKLAGGEYYVERDHSGSVLTFHAFFRKPSKHYEIEFIQKAEYAQIGISTENTLIYRRGIANHNPTIMESIFRQAYKLVLDFLYDGSAMPANQAKLWDVLDSLAGSSEPDVIERVNDDYHYQQARELMLKRKEEIKLRLLELDDAPSKRRELRAEMKGIDYCIDILDKNF